MPNYNGVWSLTTQIQYASAWPSAPTFGLFAGGNTASGKTNVIEKIIFETAGNAVDHADLSAAKEQGATFASTTSFFYAGGDDGSKVQQIDTIAVSSTGTASDFGDLLAAINQSNGGFSSPTRGFIHGGQTD